MHIRALFIQVAIALHACAALAQTAPAVAPTEAASSDIAPKNQTAESEGEIPPAAAAAPDLVRLKDGSMLRGTIGELVANDHVTIVTVTGQTRRFSLAQISYAGPAAQAPAPAVTTAPATTPSKSEAPRHGSDGKTAVASGAESATARLQLSANYPRVTFYVNSGQVKGGFTGYVSGSWHRPGELMFGEINTSYYERLCTAPCTATVPEGQHTLALGLNDEIVASESKLDLKGDLDVKGEYIDKSGWRTAGIFVFGGSMIAGLVLMLVDQGTGGAVWITGAAVALAGGITGGIMLSQSDRALVSATRSAKR